MATQPKRVSAGPATKGVRIVARSEAGFRRIGRHFGAEPTDIPLSDLTEDELAALNSERQLVVVPIDIEAKA